MTWPLGMHLATSIIAPPDGGDSLYYVWLLAWFRKALFELHSSPFIVMSHNFPLGWSLAYSEISLSNVLLALPFVPLGGPVLAYNIAILASFVLTGWFVYLWVKSFTQSAGAALVTGALFAFAPYRLAHSFGHLPLMGTQWLVLNFAGLHALLPRRPVAWKPAALAGLGLGLAGLSSMYYLYMTGVVTGVFLISYLLFVERAAWARAAFWKNLAAYALVALPFIVAAILPYLQLAIADEANHRPLGSVDFWSASPGDFFLPSPTHFLWGNWIWSHFDRSRWIEQLVYLGAVAIVLAAVAWALLPRISAHAGSLRHFGAAGLGAMVLALGTSLYWNNQRVLIQLPPALQAWLSTSQTSVPLPGRLLAHLLPFYDAMRVWVRYGVYANLFVALSGGLGWLALSRGLRSSRARIGLLLGVLVLIAVDFYQGPMPLVEAAPRPVDVWLTSQPDLGAVAYFPADMNSSPTTIYGSLFHGKPLLGMYYGAYFPKSYQAIMPSLDSFPDEASMAILRDRGAAYVVVDAAKFPRWDVVQQRLEGGSLTLLYETDGQYVYKLE